MIVPRTGSPARSGSDSTCTRRSGEAFIRDQAVPPKPKATLDCVRDGIRPFRALAIPLRQPAASSGPEKPDANWLFSQKAGYTEPA